MMIDWPYIIVALIIGMVFGMVWLDVLRGVRARMKELREGPPCNWDTMVRLAAYTCSIWPEIDEVRGTAAIEEISLQWLSREAFEQFLKDYRPPPELMVQYARPVSVKEGGEKK